MFKVVCVSDKVGTALDRLAKGVAKYHDNINYVVLDVHPKRPDPQQLEAFEREAKDADILDWQYFKTAEMLREKYDWLKDKKHILTHNNPYSIEDSNWNNYDLNVGNNQYIYKRLGEITETPVEYVPLTVDTDFWTYNLDWTPGNRVTPNNGYERQDEASIPTVLMVANRIESKKGILPVAIACGELFYKFVLVGNISDMGYFQAIEATGNIEFHENISDEELRELYYKSTVHVCNSVDGFESGTLPILESMLCGTPVMTRNVGHVPELNNGENMVLYDDDNEDVEKIRDTLFEMVTDKKKLEEIRDKGWNTAKTRSHERRAYMYQKLYRQVLYPDQESVSVVIPIYDKPDVIRKCLNAVAEQTHKNIEVIVADDNFDVSNFNLVQEYAKFVDFPVRHIDNSKEVRNDKEDNWVKDYGLARGRNEATIEATGDVIVYCDQRMIMESDAIEQFLRYLKPKHWLYGNKGAKKEFVENFSCVRREDVINAGMFCERMYKYGGLSQELRARIRSQGFQTEYIELARANPAGKSSNRNRKRQDIITIKNRLWKMNLE